MNDLKVPNSWVTCKIEQILDAQSDGKLIHQGWSPQCEKQPAEIGEWGVLKTTAIQDGFFLEEENKRLPEDKEPKVRIEVKPGDLLITNAGPRARCGVICYVKNTRSKLMISGKMYRLRFPEGLIHPEYIESWLRTSFAQKALNERKTGISESGLNMTQAKFKTLPIVVAPFAEQKVIANKLDSLLEQVSITKARLERTLETLKQFRQSILADAVSGKLTQIDNFKSEPLSKLIDEMRNGLSPKPNEDGLGYPILRISSVRAMGVDTSDTRYLECDESTKARYALKKDDLLFTRYNGSLDFVGVCGLFKGCKHETLLYPDKLIRVRTNTSKLLPKYAEIYFSSPEIRTLVTNFVKSTSGQKGISGKDLKSVVVKYPTTIEQKKIVDIVEKLFADVDATEKQVNQALERTHNLTQSILAKAFRGELTERWRKDNPELISGENSAEVLLERIQAERAAAKPNRKTRKKA